MSNVYKMETKSGYKNDEGTVLYDVTLNGESLFVGVGYTQGFEAVVAVLEDDDRYQEVCNGNMYCDQIGAEIKR